MIESWTEPDFSDGFNVFLSAAQKFLATMIDKFWLKLTNIF